MALIIERSKDVTCEEQAGRHFGPHETFQNALRV